jgi:hypothetical protein
MNNDIKARICREDFYLMMRDAVNQAGGADNVEKWKEMRLEELVNLFAQNGIRMVYMPEKHIDSLKIDIAWGELPPTLPPKTKAIPYNTAPFGRRENGPLPKKKQLLCDQKDNGDEDDSWNPAG